MRRALAAVVLLVLARPAFGTECVTLPIDVRQASVVAVARYAGERTFVVEVILRTTGERPSKLVAPDDWLASDCAPPYPAAGRPYLVAFFASGHLVFRAYDRTVSERALIEKLHVVSTRSILDVLDRYSRGDLNSAEADEWLSTAVLEPRVEGSFAEELLTAAESLVREMFLAEPCHKDVVHSIRTKKLLEASEAVARVVPPVDTVEESVRLRTSGVTDPALRSAIKTEARNEWEELLDTIRAAFRQPEKELTKLPWCDHDKPGAVEAQPERVAPALPRR